MLLWDDRVIEKQSSFYEHEKAIAETTDLKSLGEMTLCFHLDAPCGRSFSEQQSAQKYVKKLLESTTPVDVEPTSYASHTFIDSERVLAVTSDEKRMACIAQRVLSSHMRLSVHTARETEQYKNIESFELPYEQYRAPTFTSGVSTSPSDNLSRNVGSSTSASIRYSSGALPLLRQQPIPVNGGSIGQTMNPFWALTNVLVDWFSFLCRWILSIIFLGTVLSIKNESEEPLNLYIKTKFSNATGFGDWTWHLYQKGWTLIPEKARYFRINPHRRHTFMLPFCTCLIVLGTEANFTYFLVYSARAPGERFATIWTTCHTFIPRFVRVTRDLEVITKLRCGQANASKPPMTEAFKPSGYFKAVPNLAVLPRVMLPPGSRIVIGPSLVLPQAERDERRSSIFSFAVAGRMADLVNEASALIELFQIDNPNRLPFGIYLFIQIQIWNSLKNLKSPLPQGKYGSDNFWLSRDYDASSAFHLQAGAGGLQAILVLVVSQPRSGAQLLSVLLAFANLVMAATAVCSHISERGLKYITNSNMDRSKKYLMVFYPCVFLLALPVCFLVGYEYYMEVSGVVSYVVVSIVIVVMHMQQIRNTQQLDAALKGVTPALLFSMVKRVVTSIGRIISKFSVESFVAFLTVGSVVLNAVILFVVKERSL